MLKADSFSYLLICAAVAGAVFMYDLSQALGVAGGVPYVLLVLLGLIADRPRVVLSLAALSSVLTLTGYLLSAPSLAPGVVLTNRVLALLAIWSVAAAVALVIAQRLRLEKLVNRDPLTGLFNRKFLFETLQREINIWRRKGGPLSLLMLDLDHFKNINDRYGHQAGDRVLKSVAAVAEATVRMSDLVCRFGGEEFAIVLPDTDRDDALEVAERVRVAIAQLRLKLGDDNVGLTVSIGIAQMHEHHADAAALLGDADSALYHSKRSGRDRIRIAGESGVGNPLAV